METKAIEVVMTWGGNPQATELYRRPTRVVVGESADAAFVLPREVLRESFTLLEPEGESVLLCIPPGTHTIVSRCPVGGLEENLDISTIPSDQNGFRRIRLDQGMVAVVEIGEFAFYVRATEAAVRVAPPVAFDWTAYRWIAASALFHGVILSMFFMQPPDAGALSLEIDGRDRQYMDYFMAAMEQDRMLFEDTPPQPLDDQTPGNEGRPMAGDEGAAGAPDETRRTGGHVSVRGPDEDRRIPLTSADVHRLNMLGVISSTAAGLADLSSPFGAANARGWSDETYYGPLTADANGFGPGWGGFGMHGTGRGGCPVGATNCAVGTVGVGDLDTVGTTGGCSRADFERYEQLYGRAGAMDRCSGTSRSAPHDSTLRRPDGQVPGEVHIGVAEPVGGLSREEVRRVVRRNLPQVRHCYEQQLLSRPDLEGRVTVQFIIQQSGAVQSTGILSSSTGSAALEQCVAQAVRRWAFPQSPAITSVSYPFMFQHP